VYCGRRWPTRYLEILNLDSRPQPTNATCTVEMFAGRWYTCVDRSMTSPLHWIHARQLTTLSRSHTTSTSQGIGDITTNGACCCYNGVDIWQTRDYVIISCKTYIDCLLQTHGWSTPSPNESDRHDCFPLSSDTANSLQLLQGPDEGTKEHTALEISVGFHINRSLGN
jgi:hypothetical protein